MVYETESPPDTDDEYDAMEDVRIRADESHGTLGQNFSKGF